MTEDRSAGWDAVADRFMAVRSTAGVEIVRRWAARLPPGGAVLDVGCGSGVPISEALIGEGFELFGVDASPRLVSAFRRRLPTATVACEAAEDSPFFHREFDGAVTIGFLFLLPAANQRKIIGRIASALKPGGRFLFSAPLEACEWTDILTGRLSLSLGSEAYCQALDAAGMDLGDSYVDEGENHYFDARRRSR
ncbi:bifunctional 2-polyprenyl-6-hydroxyphenol methylase/3-demethylubiquinol 3-O-methyltransferase UbiG [Sphingosinicella sp. CPCC 101087]|uniref:class I SAM-dependent methyltransferase n=1 Tax=Sphingosinicella sp. CPCC 101087 TaxID=2497754 RepID=UPI00197CDD0E|nr:class I SAM-dependent methyltransferase [Sphingosinicella sp. CPCC 101087]